MRYPLIVLFFIASTLVSCGGGGSVPIYTTSSTPDTSSYTAHTGSGLARTDQGREIFQAKCMDCHGQAGNMRNNNAANLQFSRLDSLSITQTIKNGRGAMPMFKDALADSDIGHLAIYVKSLRRD